MSLDFSEMDRCTKDFIDRNRRKIRTFGFAGDKSYDSDKFTDFRKQQDPPMRNVTPPKPKLIEEKK